MKPSTNFTRIHEGARMCFYGCIRAVVYKRLIRGWLAGSPLLFCFALSLALLGCSRPQQISALPEATQPGAIQTGEASFTPAISSGMALSDEPTATPAIKITPGAYPLPGSGATLQATTNPYPFSQSSVQATETPVQTIVLSPTLTASPTPT